MLDGILKTSLHAAFFWAIILAGCSEDKLRPDAPLAQCPTLTTPVASVQGGASESPVIGQRVTVKGIVTLIQDGRGLYMEEPVSDTDDRTSNAIFVEFPDLPTGVETGSLVSVKGVVSEIGGGRYPLTALTDIEELIQCSTGHALPLTDVSLPLNGPGREVLEGMRIQVNSPLVVTDVYQFGRGNFTLSGNGLQYAPTEVMAPGPETAELLAQNKAFALPAMLSESMEHPGFLASGTTIDRISGVLAHDGRGLRISLQSTSPFTPVNFTPPVTTTAGTLRVVGMNLHEYFNGDGKGLGFPAPRGAETIDDFRRQRDRIGAAIKVLAPHVLAVTELENDGFGPDSAAQDFIRLANDTTRKIWAVARPAGDDTGSDRITVGLFYRTDRLKAIGPARTLTGAEFLRSRQPQAQLFQQLQDSSRILVVINHLKSKGSCPDTGENVDQKDGQACWNPMRLASAKKMSAWVKNIAATTATDNILILGDMNSYRNEDPIDAIRDAGFVELMDEKPGPSYSFVYYGHYGTLDYAFSSTALLEHIQRAFIWNVNTILPTRMDLPQPWLRFSDHDPVVVDLRSRHSNTSD